MQRGRRLKRNEVWRDCLFLVATSGERRVLPMLGADHKQKND